MRQIDALANHQICRHMRIENIDFVVDFEFEILKRISNFGKFSIRHFLIKDDCLGVEEYVHPREDHVEEQKPLSQHPVTTHHDCVIVKEGDQVVAQSESNKEVAVDCHVRNVPIHHHHHVQQQLQQTTHQPIPIQRPPSPVRRDVKGVELSIDGVSGNNHHHHRDGHGGGGGSGHGCVNDDDKVKEVIEQSSIDITTENSRHKFVKVREVERKSKSNKQITIATTTQTSTQTEPHHHPPPPVSSHHHPRDQVPVFALHPKHAPPEHKVLKNVSNLSLSSAGGTINLRNVSNVTINSHCPRLKSAPMEKESHESTTVIHTDGPECGFYDRLITENKQLQYQVLKNGCSRRVTTKSITSPMSSMDTVHIETTGPTHTRLETNTTIGHDEHPVQVQQWLKQIVYETETEPVLNSEFMEFVNIKR